MSDRAIPRSFRFMEGFGVHTFRLVNKEGKSTFVKFHWKPKLGTSALLTNDSFVLLLLLWALVLDSVSVFCFCLWFGFSFAYSSRCGFCSNLVSDLIVAVILVLHLWGFFFYSLGLQSVLWDEALKINGADPDFHRRDLREAIESGNFPEWELGLQLFDEAFAESFAFDILDSTKIIPEEEVPITLCGRLVLNKNVDNFFFETEQVAFCTANVPPGIQRLFVFSFVRSLFVLLACFFVCLIVRLFVCLFVLGCHIFRLRFLRSGIDFTNDPLLQGRNFSYLDTQLTRLGGPNFNFIAINSPKCPFFNFQQDGHMAMTNPHTRANYEPNSWGIEHGGGKETRQDVGFRTFPLEARGKKQRHRSATFADHFSQPRQFYISQTPTEQLHIASAFIFELSKCEKYAK
jgi:catalase